MSENSDSIEMRTEPPSGENSLAFTPENARTEESGPIPDADAGADVVVGESSSSTPAQTGNGGDSDDEAVVCRVCHCEAEPSRPLFHPCKCAGSIKHVHQVDSATTAITIYHAHTNLHANMNDYTIYTTLIRLNLCANRRIVL